MNTTAIEWTTFSANPLKYRRKNDSKVVWGCVKSSPGCANCYSEAIALRFERGKLFNARNMEELEPFLDESELRKMLTAKTIGGVDVDGSRCFVGDMTDLFGEWVSDELLDRLFAVFALRPTVTWQVLTKRAERMAAYMGDINRSRWWAHAALDFCRADQKLRCVPGGVKVTLPALNVHLGVSAENRKYWDERVPLLKQCPAAARFLSAEPLLDDLGDITKDLRGSTIPCPDGRSGCEALHVNSDHISQLIIGGESGPHARPCRVEWVRSLVSQCRTARVACFVKQLGSNYDDTLNGVCGKSTVWPFDIIPGGPTYRLKDPKGGDMAEWPTDLRVREWPTAGGN